MVKRSLLVGLSTVVLQNHVKGFGIFLVPVPPLDNAMRGPIEASSPESLFESQNGVEIAYVPTRPPASTQPSIVVPTPMATSTIVQSTSAPMTIRQGKTVSQAAYDVWQMVQLSDSMRQIALSSVSYNSNYDKTLKTRVCLHRINSIRTSQSNNLIKFLFSIDGCELSQVQLDGKCDIYTCRLYTYEIKLTQKAPGSYIYAVTSITREPSQKPLSDIMGPGNVDFSAQGLVGSDNSQEEDDNSGRSRRLNQPSQELLASSVTEKGNVSKACSSPCPT